MASYQRIPTSAQQADEVDEQDQLSLQNPLTQSTIDEFNRQPPALWKRLAVIATILLLGWGAVKLGQWGEKKRSPEIIYASRYSDEFKYRPAESPVITEYLKDGRIRLRGAHPGGVGVPPEKMPLRPEQKAYQEKKKREEIKERAKKKLEEEKLRKKQRSKAARAKAKANKGKGKSEQSAVDGSKEF